MLPSTRFTPEQWVRHSKVMRARCAVYRIFACDHSHDADFSSFEPYILKIAAETLKMVYLNKLSECKCPNREELKGIKTARQCHGQWMKEFAMKTDPHGRDYFWLTGFLWKLRTWIRGHRWVGTCKWLCISRSDNDRLNSSSFSSGNEKMEFIELVSRN